MWTEFVDLIRATIFATAHACSGSLGGGVLLVSAVVRLALLPLTLRMARQMALRQKAIAALAPELERLRKKFAKEPARLYAETQALHTKHGIKLFEFRPLVAGAIQIPFLAGVFSAVRSGLGAGVRFAWIADLARPDKILVVVVAGLSAAAMSLAPAPPQGEQLVMPMIVISMVMTLLFLSSASSAVALSWGAGSAVSALQNWMLRREARLAAA
jgi:YidC/Oxa1 family membrane protein insertase